MRQSKLFGSTNKDSRQYDSVNATLLEKGGFIDKAMAGVYTFLPLGNRVLQKIIGCKTLALASEQIVKKVIGAKIGYAGFLNLPDSVEVLFDDRANVSAGEKFADSDLIGIPWRLVVSEKTNGKVELKSRRSKEVEFLTVEQLLTKLKKNSD